MNLTIKIKLQTFLKKFLSSTIILLSVFLTVACDPSTAPATIDEVNTASNLNDTGVILFTQTFPVRLPTDPKPVALTNTPDTSAPGQDAEKGKDGDSNNSNNDGIAGFKFTKLDATGKALENQANSYTTEAWQCVKDEVTGLIWEVKTLSGLQDSGNSYTWYEPNPSINGGNSGEIGDNLICADLNNCNTSEYIKAINAMNDGKGLCGSKNWRLPLREELRSLIDYSVTSGPMIDTNFFPNAIATDTWTSQTAFYRIEDGTEAWEVHFDLGYSEAHEKNSRSVAIRLVH